MPIFFVNLKLFIPPQAELTQATKTIFKEFLRLQDAAIGYPFEIFVMLFITL
jgi:hypothetical protein